MTSDDEVGISRKTAEVLIQEWRIAAADERGDRDASVAYREAAAELEHNLKSERDAGRGGDASPDDCVTNQERKPCGEYHPLPCGLDVDCAKTSDEDPRGDE